MCNVSRWLMRKEKQISRDHEIGMVVVKEANRLVFHENVTQFKRNVQNRRNKFL